MSEDTHVKALAAENARLRQDLERAGHNAKTWHGRWVRAQAEVEVLRHRDRQTQAVVGAAVAWNEGHRDGASQATRPIHERFLALRAAVDAYENGPTEPLATPQSDEQPPDVPEEATAGPEAQGGAQRARGWAGEATCAGCGDHWPTCPDCGGQFCADSCFDDHRELGTCPKHADGHAAQPSSEASWLARSFHETYERLAPAFGYKTREASAKPWAEVPEQNKKLMIAVCVELLPAIERRLLPLRTRLPDGRTPRVWNAGDPEPEGVLEVLDVDGDRWRHLGEQWGYYLGDLDETNWVGWDALTHAHGPLTEVLPEPAAPTAADLQAARDQTRADATAMLGAADNDQDPAIPKTAFRCREEYIGLGLDPTARIVRCNLPLDHEGDHDEMIDGERGNHWPRKPDGEVPEAGRAGEAQDDPKARALADAEQAERMTKLVDPEFAHFWQKRATDKRAEAQDRTEGLDAAIEAIKVRAGDDIPWLRPGEKPSASAVNGWLADKIRAASPLIERAALHALAELVRLKDGPRGAAYERDKPAAWEAARALLRDRATRTETS